MMPIEWPAGLKPKEMTWGRVFNSRAFTSPFTQSQQVVTHPGAFWKCTLSFRAMYEDEERIFSTFLGELQGMAGTFYLYPWRRARAVEAGAARVDGSGLASGSLRTRGWNISQQVLTRGDYITVNDQLLEVLHDVYSNGEGRATIRVSPWLRRGPSDGDVIEYLNPYAVMRLTSDDEERTVKPLVAGGSIEAREAF